MNTKHNGYVESSASLTTIDIATCKQLYLNKIKT